uniref:Uncharacterized protein n=1 Tax=Triticum urartu TaxID=4572 RepID=A0A8R7URH7_TRIUA
MACEEVKKLQALSLEETTDKYTPHTKGFWLGPAENKGKTTPETLNNSFHSASAPIPACIPLQKTLPCGR